MTDKPFLEGDRHASLRRSEDVRLLEDAGSTNGSDVNGSRCVRSIMRRRASRSGVELEAFRVRVGDEGHAAP